MEMEDPFTFYAQSEPTKIMEGLDTSSAGEFCSIGKFVYAGDGRSTGGFCSAQPKPMMMKKNIVEKVVKSSKVFLSSKRAKAVDEEDVSTIRKPESDSFKSRLLGMSNPSTWGGFVSKRDKLKIDAADITISEGLEGPVMEISIVEEAIVQTLGECSDFEDYGESPHSELIDS
ncbi:hypothetical protein ACOSP7_013936 [Xanthoceras sorbifolium]